MTGKNLTNVLSRYGGTSFPTVPWIFPAIAICIVTFGAYAIYLSVFTYFADVLVPFQFPALTESLNAKARVMLIQFLDMHHMLAPQWQPRVSVEMC